MCTFCQRMHVVATRWWDWHSARVAPDHDDADRFYREFGKHLHDARSATGLSQEALGTAVGLNRTSISNIEKGRQRLLMHQLPVLARILGVSVGDLLPDAPDTDALRGLSGADRDAVATIRQKASSTATAPSSTATAS